MSAGEEEDRNPGSPAKSVADEKAQRRAELRANLRRRKVQQRDRAETEKTSTDESEQIR